MKVTCKQCKAVFEKRISYVKRTKNNFCSKSCANTYSNLLSPKRKRSKKCKFCKSLVISNRSFCKKCINIGRHLRGGIRLDEKTIAECILGKKNDANKFSIIRKHAANKTKSWPRKCLICGYDKHVETCHKKPIRVFLQNTKLKEVNSPKNLTLLCPNHHWELDHELLTWS